MTPIHESSHSEPTPHRLDAAGAPWLADPAIQAVMAALAANGARPRFVGGCVRNAFIAAGATDVDVAIDVAPEETAQLLETAGLRAIPTGIEHGTITTLADAEPIEVTSLRRDVETDGRRAVVAFTRDWAEDAARRDFTMNALYADAAGRVFDPIGSGVADLTARRVRFIGRAEDRIREDYLRILRFYRFKAWYGDGGADPGDLAAIAALKDGVARLARERIGHEMRKLLTAPRPARAVSAMAEQGVLEQVSAAASAGAIAALQELETRSSTPARWMRRLGALFGRGMAVSAVAEALRLSNKEEAALAALAAARGAPAAEAGYRFGAEAAEDALLLNAAEGGAERDAQALAADLEAARAGAAQRFPLAARDLIDAGMAPGPALGAALKSAEDAWIASGFALDKARLLTEAAGKGQTG